MQTPHQQRPIAEISDIYIGGTFSDLGSTHPSYLCVKLTLSGNQDNIRVAPNHLVSHIRQALTNELRAQNQHHTGSAVTSYIFDKYYSLYTEEKDTVTVVIKCSNPSIRDQVLSTALRATINCTQFADPWIAFTAEKFQEILSRTEKDQQKTPIDFFWDEENAWRLPYELPRLLLEIPEFSNAVPGWQRRLIKMGSPYTPSDAELLDIMAEITQNTRTKSGGRNQ